MDNLQHLQVDPPELSFIQTPILLAVIGLTPPIITENVYAIHKEREKKALETGQSVDYLQEIYVVTTTAGFEALKKVYFQSSETSQLMRMLQQYNWPEIKFTEEHVTVVKDLDGCDLNDINNLIQHEGLANTIMQFVLQFTSQCWRASFKVSLPHDVNKLASRESKDNWLIPRLNAWYRDLIPGFIDVRPLVSAKSESKLQIKKGMYSCEISAFQYHIHASLAGGRKSMTYFIGNMMNYFGRKGDELSHVLVSENAERCRQFFYPDEMAPEMHYFRDREEKDKVKFHAKDESIYLAEIPFLRLADTLQTKVGFSDFNYSDLIDFYNQSDLSPTITLQCVPDKTGLFPPREARHILMVNGKELKTKLSDGMAAWLMTVMHTENNHFIQFGRRKNRRKIYLLYLQKLSWLATGEQCHFEDEFSWLSWLAQNDDVQNSSAYMAATLGKKASSIVLPGNWIKTLENCLRQKELAAISGGLIAKIVKSAGKVPLIDMYNDVKNLLEKHLHPDVIAAMMPTEIAKVGKYSVLQVQLPVNNVEIICT